MDDAKAAKSKSVGKAASLFKKKAVGKGGLEVLKGNGIEVKGKGEKITRLDEAQLRAIAVNGKDLSAVGSPLVIDLSNAAKVCTVCP